MKKFFNCNKLKKTIDNYGQNMILYYGSKL